MLRKAFLDLGHTVEQARHIHFRWVLSEVDLPLDRGGVIGSEGHQVLLLGPAAWVRQIIEWGTVHGGLGPW